MNFTRKITTLLPNLDSDFIFTEYPEHQYYFGKLSGILHKADNYTLTKRFFSKKLWEKIINQFKNIKAMFGPPDPNTGRNNLSTVFLHVKNLEMKENLDIFVDIEIMKNDLGKEFLIMLENNVPFDIRMSGYGTTYCIDENRIFSVVSEDDYNIVSIFFAPTEAKTTI